MAGMKLEEQMEWFRANGLELRIKITETGFMVGTQAGHVEDPDLGVALENLKNLVAGKEIKYV